MIKPIKKQTLVWPLILISHVFQQDILVSTFGSSFFTSGMFWFRYAQLTVNLYKAIVLQVTYTTVQRWIWNFPLLARFKILKVQNFPLL